MRMRMRTLLCVTRRTINTVSGELIRSLADSMTWKVDHVSGGKANEAAASTAGLCGLRTGLFTEPDPPRFNDPTGTLKIQDMTLQDSTKNSLQRLRN